MDYPKEYLGDGVHAECDGYHITLTVPGTSHQSGQDQRIALEPACIERLLQYRKMLEGLERIESKAAAVACNECDDVLDSVVIRDLARKAILAAKGGE